MNDNSHVFSMVFIRGKVCVALELLCQLIYLGKSIFLKHLRIFDIEVISHPTVIRDKRDEKGCSHPKMALNQSISGIK